MKRRTIYISLLLIFIIGIISLIGTFATDTTITEGNSSNADYLFNIALGSRTNREVVIPSYDSKVIDIKISNPNPFKMKYLLYLEGTNTNISVINIGDNESIGILNSNTTTLVKIFIQNNSNSNITISIKDLVGFESDELSLPSNSTSIDKGNYYKVKVTSNNGRIKPSIKLSTTGGTLEYTLVPNTGYQYKSNTCAGSVSNNIMTISNITSNKNCTVEFEAIEVTVSFNLDGGNIEPINYTTPEEHQYTVPYTGNYKLEVWGAQGGKGNNVQSGYGGYSTGTISLDSGDKMYVNVGGMGNSSNTSSSSSVTGGYNGGGNGFGHTDKVVSGGGGATHIATVSGQLKNLSSNISSILIVAGGGGGSAYENTNSIGGSGGGMNGVASQSYNSNYTSTGATQTSSGTGYFPGSFGLGGCNATENGCSGGGGGYYGGDAARYAGGGAGGSGYIGNSLLTNKVMYCYNCTESSDVSTKTISTTNVSGTAKANYAKSGNGAARITLISDIMKTITYSQSYGELPVPVKTGHTFDGWYTGQNGTGTKITDSTALTIASNHTLYAKWIKNPTISFNLDGGNIEPLNYTTPQQHTYTVPYTGNYKLEVWGAQGGSYNTTYYGGYGGYSVGNASLSENTKLYINVGGAGNVASSLSTTVNGGYNGGGNAVSKDSRASSGGGATHIATAAGALKNLVNNKGTIIIVAGGGGGSNYYNDSYASGSGGSGGGYIGGTGILNGNSTNTYVSGTGGTQETGNAFGEGASTSEIVWCHDGGGGGYYGGYQGAYGGGGGGSGYIGNSLLTNKVMYCYNCTESSATATKTVSTTNVSGSAKANYAKSGNGAARITLISDIMKTITYSQSYGELPVPVKIGHTFDGWYTGQNGTGTEVTSSTIVTNTSDHTLYAKWVANTYTISYSLNGGTSGSSAPTSGTYGSTVTVSNPTKAHHTFTGWTVSGTGASMSGTTLTIGAGNITLTANWEPNTYTISYNLNGGTSGSSAPTSGKYGSTVTVSNPTKAHYTFSGWTVSGTGASMSGTTLTIGTSNITLTANWNINSYYLDLNGLLDGSSSGGIVGYGTADVYINNTLVCNDCTDYYTQHPYGTSYSISDIKSTSGHTYNGVHSGSLSGTISGATSVVLKFSTNRTTPVFTYTGSYQIVNDSNATISDPSTYAGNWKIRFLSSGTLTFSSLGNASSGIDIFVVGGGGAGAKGTPYIYASSGGGSGGGGAAITVRKLPVSTGTSYSIVVGGASSNSSFGAGSTAYFTALGGGTAAYPERLPPTYVWTVYYGSGGAGRLSGQTNNYGASSVVVRNGASGNGVAGNYEFDESGNKRYGAAGGKGAGYNLGITAGGADGGGNGGGACTDSNGAGAAGQAGGYAGQAGGANTGSGGGGGGGACGTGNQTYGLQGSGGSGGSGIVIIRNTRS